jgi:UDP-glucose 4-epimerase
MKERRILLTGVCGMIGSHLLEELLKSGDRVIGVDNLSFGKTSNLGEFARHPRFKCVRADILDGSAGLYRKVGPVDQVVHLAAVKKIGEADPALPTIEVNGEGTHAVLEYAKRSGASFVLGSTSDVYGVSPDLPFAEDGRCVLGASTAKRWAYATAKLYAEHLTFAYHKDKGVPSTVLRFFGGFSERSNASWSGGHVPIFILAILEGKPVVIHGDGRQTRSMAHVSDLVRGTVLAMRSRKALGEIINLGNDEEVSVVETARMIHRLSGVKTPLKIQFVPMKKVFGSYEEIARRVPDLHKARRLLGYRPRMKFVDSLKLVLRTIRSAA